MHVHVLQQNHLKRAIESYDLTCLCQCMLIGIHDTTTSWSISFPVLGIILLQQI